MAHKPFTFARQEKSWRILLATALVAGMWVTAGQAETPPATFPGMQASGSAPVAVPQAKSPAGTKTRRRAAKPSSAQPVPLPASRQVVGRRDPFKLPEPPVPGRPGEGIATGPVAPGKRGLVIGQLKLEGIIRLDATSEMIAVVDTTRNRAYFLRENDELSNGVVSRITPDSVYFRENVLDQEGRVQTREVVKRLGQAAGEGR